MTNFMELIRYQGTLLEKLFQNLTYPWEALPLLSDYLLALGPQLASDEYDVLPGHIWIHKTARVASSASLSGPLIVCSGAEIRHAAFIRGKAFIGSDSVVGNSSELKNTVMLERVQLPHYNYAGDSIFGYHSHMGAGAITSNVKADHSLIRIHDGSLLLDSGLRKFGALVGDYGEIGCNSVLNPGTVIGQYSRVYPLCSVRGVIPSKHILKQNACLCPLLDDRED